MADPLSITAGVIGITAPALHGIRLLLDDLQHIKDAPAAIQALEDHLHRVSRALSSLQVIEPGEWESLGRNITDEATATVRFCSAACDQFRADLQRWTSHSQNKHLSWRDRATVGVFKQGRIKSMQGQLQNCQITINSVVSIATLYSSIRHARMTEDTKTAISAKQDELATVAKTTDAQLAKVAEMLEQLGLRADIHDVDTTEAERGRQLREEQHALQTSRKLVDGLLAKVQEDARWSVAAENAGRSTQVTFGSQNTGLQIGVSHGSITFGR